MAQRPSRRQQVAAQPNIRFDYHVMLKQLTDRMHPDTGFVADDQSDEERACVEKLRALAHDIASGAVSVVDHRTAR